MSEILYDLNATGDEVNKVITEITNNLKANDNWNKVFYVKRNEDDTPEIGIKIVPASEVSYSDEDHHINCDNVQDAIDYIIGDFININENEIPLGDGEGGLKNSGTKYYEHIESHYTKPTGFPKDFPNETELILNDHFVFYNGVDSSYSINETYVIDEEEYNLVISLTQSDEENIVVSINDKSLNLTINELLNEIKEFNVDDSEYKVNTYVVPYEYNSVTYYHTYIDIFSKNFSIDPQNPPKIRYVLNNYEFSTTSLSPVNYSPTVAARISNKNKSNTVNLYSNIKSKLNSDKTERIFYLIDGTKMSSEYVSIVSEEIIDIDENILHFPNDLPLKIVGGNNSVTLATNSKNIDDTELDGQIRPEEEVALLRINSKAKANFLDNSTTNISDDAKVIIEDSAITHINNLSKLYIHAGEIHIDNGDHETQITSFYKKEYRINVSDYESIYPNDSFATLEHILEIENSENSNYIIINITKSDDLINSSLTEDTFETNGYTKTIDIKKYAPSNNLPYYSTIITYTKIYNPKNPYGSFTTPTILMHGSPCLCLEKVGTLMAKDNSALILEKNGKIMARDNATVYLNGNSLFIMDSSRDTDLGSSLVIDNGCQIVFNGYGSSFPKDKGYPYLICGPNEFVYDSQASDGNNSTIKPSAPHCGFGDPSLLNETVNRPRFRIGGNTMIMIDSGTSSTGSNYIKIGANNDEKLEFHLTGNIFQQMTGNTHIETHDDSKVVMRGTLKNENDTQIPPWMDSVENIPDSMRPIQQGDNGPICGLYDNSTIMIRGRWDNTYNTMEKELSMSKNFNSSELTILSGINNNYLNIELINNSNFQSEYRDLYNELIQKAIKSNLKYNIPEEFMRIKSLKITKSDTKYYYMNISYIVEFSKPDNWNEHLPKKENSPYIEIIENSELKLSDNAKIDITDNFSISTSENGFIFSDGSNTVSFTISELQQLKALLS